MSVIITIIIFSIIVVVHEWGHMRVAKACGVYVEEFAIGMGPKLIGVKKGDTLYTIRMLPLGGFCRMADESDKERGINGFTDASVWKRMAICVAGPFMNFVLAFIVMVALSMMTAIGTCEVGDVYEDMPAHEAGLAAGDRVVSVNGKGVHISSEINYEISQHSGETLEIGIIRGGEHITKTVVPKFNEEENRYLIGITLVTKAPLINVGLYKEISETMPRATISECVNDGFWNGIFIIRVTFDGLVKLITRDVSVNELSGPIGVTSVVGETYNDAKKISIAATLVTMADITALLSVNLGLLNLLPIPALDGGKLLIYFVEVIRRKKIPPEKEGMINLAGFAIIMALAVVVAYNDIVKLIK